jgi:hypothetical protein
MRRRVANTYKILAVAMVAGGCATAESAPKAPERLSAPAPFEIAPVELKSAAAPEEVGAAEPPPPPLPPGPKESLDPTTKARLNTLLAELLGSERAEVKARMDHFRPLCDEAGYPLVGNVVRKGAPGGYQPSEVCAEVRTKAAR